MKFVHLFKDDPRLPIVKGRPIRVALCDTIVRREVDVSVWEAEWRWCPACQRIQTLKAGVSR